MSELAKKVPDCFLPIALFIDGETEGQGGAQSKVVVVYVVESLKSCLTLCDPVDCSLPGSSVHGVSPGKNTRVGCHAFLQGIFSIRDRTQVSHIACGFFTI